MTYQGPSGTGSSITTDGTVTWKYIGGTVGSGSGQTNWYWQAAKSYASNACLLLPQNGIMWANLTGGSFTSTTVMPSGLVSSSPAATVTDGSGTWTQIPLWQPNTVYTTNTSYVSCNGAVYNCTAGGTSYNGPTVSSSTQTEGSITWTYEATPSGSWAASTAYVSTGTISALSPSVTTTFICTTGGTSGLLQPIQMTSSMLQSKAFTPNAGITTTDGLAMGALPWQASYTYQIGQRVVNTATPYMTNVLNMYQCTAAGTSATSIGPTTTSNAITDNGVTWAYMGPAVTLGMDATNSNLAVPAWVTSTAYGQGAMVRNNAGHYICIVGGTTGATGPSGTTNGQTDGTVTWNYIGNGPPNVTYDLTTRPGTLGTVGGYGLGQKTVLPNVFIVWAKVGQTYNPLGSPTTQSTRGSFIYVYDSLEGGSQLRIGYVAEDNSGGIGWGLSAQCTVSGSSKLGDLWVYNTSANAKNTINYIAVMVQGNNGATNQIVSYWAAGPDGSWFAIPLTSTGAVANPLLNVIQAGKNNWNYVSIVNINLGPYYSGATGSYWDYIRGKFNSSVLP